MSLRVPCMHAALLEGTEAEEGEGERHTPLVLCTEHRCTSRTCHDKCPRSARSATGLPECLVARKGTRCLGGNPIPQ
eukprot:5776567-Alexandrium_andersonii.AAC.1